MSLSRGVCACVAVAVVGAAGASAARPGPVNDGTLTVRDGRAATQLRLKGSVIGRIANGRIAVTSSPFGTTSAVVRGWEKRQFNGATTVYIGKNIRFRVGDARRFTVRLTGKGLNYSAVGRGDGWLDGWGDPAAGVFFDGSFSLNGDAYRSLPDLRTTFELQAPPPPPGIRG
jgi:hypothetical protein